MRPDPSTQALYDDRLALLSFCAIRVDERGVTVSHGALGRARSSRLAGAVDQLLARREVRRLQHLCPDAGLIVIDR